MASGAIGRVFRLYAERPGPELNELVSRSGWLASRADDEANEVVLAREVVGDDDPKVAIVRIDGPIEQRADTECGWWDGHDAIAERMIAALEVAPVVLLVLDTPGGAVAGLQEAIRRVEEVKARTGGKVIAFADEMIASAGYWWAACCADEIYGPTAMTVGSIGARAAHVSIAGMLTRDGVTITEFSDPPGKIALTETQPLSKLGQSRGEREVRSIAEQFRSAVSSHRPTLTREALLKLNGDMLRGQDAVTAGLVDGVSTIEEVTRYALDLASAEGDEPMGPKPGIRAEDEKPEDDKDKKPVSEEAPPEKKDSEPPPEKDEGEDEGDKKTCAECNEENDKDAKYCDACGEPLEKKEEAATDEPPPEKTEGDDKDKDAKPESRAAATSYAGLLGLSASAGHPAIKSALMAHVACSRKAMALTGKDSPAQATGALQAMADEAAKVHGLEEKVSASAKREEYRARNDLLTKLAAANLPGCSRGELFVDKISADGKRTATVPAPLYATTPIETLRGFVDAKLANKSPRSVSNPFEPDASAAKAKSRTGHVAVVQDGELATNISARTGIPSDRVAGSLAALQESGAIAGEDR